MPEGADGQIGRDLALIADPHAITIGMIGTTIGNRGGVRRISAEDTNAIRFKELIAKIERDADALPFGQAIGDRRRDEQMFEIYACLARGAERPYGLVRYDVFIPPFPYTAIPTAQFSSSRRV